MSGKEELKKTTILNADIADLPEGEGSTQINIQTQYGGFGDINDMDEDDEED